MIKRPITGADITSAWLNEALDDRVTGGATIVGVDAEVIGAGVGMVGEVTRLRLSYDRLAPNAATSVIVKTPTTNDGFKALGLMLGLYGKEAGFFREVAPEIRLRVPTCFYNYADGTDFMLILEDLAPMRPGDQLQSCTLAEAHQALAEVARLHARWWEDPRLLEFSSWLPGPGDGYFDIVKGGYLGAVDHFHTHFGYLVNDEVTALINRCAADYDTMAAVGVYRSPHTFIHGDFRLDNMMFGDDPSVPSVVVLDWQLPCRLNPMSDVVYFLAGNFEPQWRRDHEDELIGAYHQTLLENGVENYPLDKCHEDYRACGLILLAYLVTGSLDVDLETLNDRGRALIEMMYSRYATAIVDLRSGDFMTN